MNESLILSAYPFLLLQAIEVAPTKYSLPRAAALTGIHAERILYYCRLGLLSKQGSCNDEGTRFDDDDLYLLRRFEHYRCTHRLRRKTLRLIFCLVNEVEHLRAEIRFLRS